MPWSVIFCEEFDEEFRAMPKELQKAIMANAIPLEEFGPSLGRPRVDTLMGSAYQNMKELRFDWIERCLANRSRLRSATQGDLTCGRRQAGI